MGGEQVAAEQARGRVHLGAAAHLLQRAADGQLAAMAARQALQPIGDLAHRCLGIGDVGDAAQIGVAEVELGLLLQAQQHRRVIKPGIAAHARSDGHLFRGLGAAPQQHGVKGAVVQVVEGRVARQSRDDIDAVGFQLVGEGEEIRIGRADRQHPQWRVDIIQVINCFRRYVKRRAARIELFLGDAFAHQMLDHQHDLLRVGVVGKDHVPAFGDAVIVGLAHQDDRHAARPGGVTQARGDIGPELDRGIGDHHRFDGNVA